MITHRMISSGQIFLKTRGVLAMSIWLPVMHTRPSSTVQASRVPRALVWPNSIAKNRPRPKPPSRPTSQRTTGCRGLKASVSPERSLRRMRQSTQLVTSRPTATRP